MSAAGGGRAEATWGRGPTGRAMAGKRRRWYSEGNRVRVPTHIRPQGRWRSRGAHPTARGATTGGASPAIEVPKLLAPLFFYCFAEAV
jgi:hypothetical protein